LDAETGRPKSPPKYANARRDQNLGSERWEIPAERPYLASYRKRAVCGDWMVETLGLKLGTHHPVIEPVSKVRVRNGIFRCRDRRSNPPFCLAETDTETGGELEKARCPRDKCTERPRSSIPEDWVVVCAVICEPVSSDFRLRTGNYLQNSANNRLRAGFG
jgi:hypothetical protein